ncbi:MAG: hypothetical protein A2048_00845 [Deltaproteobacteria bacterium GWA2_45_12]|nr:MAG: hypothetical protein A2048_00845 [Deltaproteobacteria bacterium GWA2_45_12]
MPRFKQNKSERQRLLRQRRNERPFLFDPQFTRCLGAAEREIWEEAISFSGGDVTEAAEECGLKDIPRGTKVLWGRSAEEALGTYRRWQKQNSK